MDAEEVAGWRAVVAGEAQLSWDLWSARIASSQVLTSVGQRELRNAVEVIAGFLSADWLAKALDVARSKPAAKGLPFISPRWWPTTDNVRVYERILHFAAQLRILAQSPGLAQVRRAMRRDLGHFEHGLLQLEVASLARRAEWSTAFEPKPDPTRSRVTDLRLTRDGDAMLVEVKGFQLDDWIKHDQRLADKMRMAMLRLEAEYDVYISGENGSPDDDTQLEAWLTDLAHTAVAVDADGQDRDLTPPFGGRLTLRKRRPPLRAEIKHSMPIRHRDESRRISDQIDKKADQGRGSEPLWLRFEETPEFWALTGPSEARVQWVESLAQTLQQRAAGHKHVAGLVLSGPARAHSTRILRESFPVLDGRGSVISCTIDPPFWRESLLIPGAHPASALQLAHWHDWYLNEASWLDWALVALDAPPRSRLFSPR